MLKSLRNLPDDPPSSVTVTTAAKSEIRKGSLLDWPGWATWRRSPRSSVDKPVPPPMATTRMGRGARPETTSRAPMEVPKADFSDFKDQANRTNFLWNFRI